jgi:hypothetical protein
MKYYLLENRAVIGAPQKSNHQLKSGLNVYIIHNKNTQSHLCFQEGNNQSQPCFQEGSISANIIYKGYNNTIVNALQAPALFS